MEEWKDLSAEDPGKELARGTADSSVGTTKFISGLDVIKQESS